MNPCLTRPSAALAALTLTVYSFLGGCASTGTATRTSTCLAAAPANLQALSADAQAFLAQPGCQARFHDYFAVALQRAESAPDPANRARFAELLNRSAQQGVISNYEAQQLYNRYFHTTFVSLPDEYNVCSTLRNKEPLLEGLNAELTDKRRGILTVAADRAGFQEAQRQHTELLLVLEATALACTDN